jgi:hypothetical protein
MLDAEHPFTAHMDSPWLLLISTLLAEPIRRRFPDSTSGHAQQLLSRCDEARAEFVEQAVARDTSK